MKLPLKLNAQFLVAIISLSLAGIIGLQTYLFRSAIIVRDARFKAEAASALERVGSRMDALEAQRYLSANVKNPYLIQDNLANIFADSIFIVNKNGKAQADTFILGSNQYIHRGFDSGLDTTSMTGFNDQMKMRAAAAQQNYNAQMQERLQHIDTLFRQMLYQGMGSVVPLATRFTKKEIDSILAEEFAQKGLDLTYEYALVEDGYISPLRSENFDINTADFKVPLYQNDFFSGPKWLLISFPNRINFLLQSMWYMLALSAFFTGVIIIAFGYTVNQMQKQKKISQIKSDFISNMTHEFKTPIATINLAIDALSNPKVVGDLVRTKHYHQLIKEENIRMHAQVEKVLQLAMLDKQELQLTLEEIDFHELINDAANSLFLQFEKIGAQLEMNLNAENYTVRGDLLHLTNVVVNLLDNALKYAAENPKINLTTQNSNGHILLAIQDNGMGMNKDVQRKIFDRFYRETHGNVHDVKGHGLGLSYVLEIVEMHNGTIRVESTPNVGSTFFIELKTTS